MEACLCRRQCGDDSRIPASMTVFFCLAMLMISAIFCVSLESARTAGLRFMARAASDSALQSVFADYHGRLWEDYHVFFHHEPGALTDSLGEYLSYYEEPTRGIYSQQEYVDFWDISVETVNVTDSRTALSDGGRLFLEQAVEYEKYQVTKAVLGELLDRADLLDEVEKIRSFAVRLSACFEQVQKISTLYQEVRDGVTAVLQISGYLREMVEGGLVDMDELRDGVGELSNAVIRLSALAENYLDDSEDVGRLVSELTSEYGDQEDTVYGQQIMQLRAFTLEGMIGETIGRIVQTTDYMLSQISSVQEALEQMREAKEIGTESSGTESSDTENGDEERSQTEAAYAERWEQLRRQILEVLGEGIGLMQGVQSGLEQAVSAGGDSELDQSGGDAWTGSAEDENAGQSLLEIVKQFKNMAVLSLVMGERAMSTRADRFSEPSSLPSAVTQETLDGVTATEKGLFIFYITDTFSNVLSAQQSEFAYQQEYILFGKSDSRSNLTAMAERLLVLREGMNLAFLLTNTQMRTLAGNVASALVGGTGVYPLVLVTQFLLLAAWAFAESVSDVRCLFDGERVPLWKTEENWRTAISGLVSGDGLPGIGQGAELTLSYKDYLMLFLLIRDTGTLCLRSMDVIQQEIGSREGGFLMADCYGAASVTVQFSSPYRLITLPLVGADTGGGHQIQVLSSYSYS